MKKWSAVPIVLFLTVFFAASAQTPDAANVPARSQKQIALTFDDGPRPLVLEHLLPLLKDNNIHASFFVNGWAVVDNPPWVLRVSAEGHALENHTYGHENFKKVFAEKGVAPIRRSIERTADAISKITGAKPHFFRPPFWEITPEIEQIITGMGYRVVKLGNPDINTLDYDDVSNKRPVSTLIERVKKQIADRERDGKYSHVLVMHELPLTVEALKVLIPYFKGHGYSFIRIDEMYGR